MNNNLDKSKLKLGSFATRLKTPIDNKVIQYRSLKQDSSFIETIIESQDKYYINLNELNYKNFIYIS